jgi:hypothetical protein
MVRSFSKDPLAEKWVREADQRNAEAEQRQKPAAIAGKAQETPRRAQAGAGRFALGRLPVGQMNRTEGAYDAHLYLRQTLGEILWYKFEGLKFRLADNTFYSPDFAVMLADGVIELHEVKGGPWMDDARVKIKVAAAMYPFRFVGVKVKPKRDGGGWEYEDFSGKEKP